MTRRRQRPAADRARRRAAGHDARSLRGRAPGAAVRSDAVPVRTVPGTGTPVVRAAAVALAVGESSPYEDVLAVPDPVAGPCPRAWWARARSRSRRAALEPALESSSTLSSAARSTRVPSARRRAAAPPCSAAAACWRFSRSLPRLRRRAVPRCSSVWIWPWPYRASCDGGGVVPRLGRVKGTAASSSLLCPHRRLGRRGEARSR